MTSLSKLVAPLSEQVFWGALSARSNPVEKIEGICPCPTVGMTHFCALCNVTYYLGDTHRRETNHQGRMENCLKIRRLACDRMGMILANAAKYEPLISRLESDKWKEGFRRSLIPTYPELSRMMVQEPHQEFVPIAMDEKLIAVKCFRERMALLEMSAWKSVIISTEGGQHCGTSDVIRLLNFLKNGWKAHKGDYRAHSSIHIVLRRVLPFLDRHEFHRNTMG